MTTHAGNGDDEQVLFDGPVHLHHGFLALRPRGSDPADPGQEYAGQRNGLVGARQAGALAMRAGTHTGDVPLRIEAHSGRPDVPEGWEEVVEVPFVPAGTVYSLAAFDFHADVAVPAGTGRARWCATGMDAAHQEPADPPDRYLLQLWPAADAPEDVVRETSMQARYWAGVAQDAYPVDLPPARAWVDRSREDPRRRLQEEMQRRLREPWRGGPAQTVRMPGAATREGRRGTGVPGAGAPAARRTPPRGPAPASRRAAAPGDAPTPAPVDPRALRARATWLAAAHPALAARLSTAPTDQQRAVAAWAARRLAAAAGVLADDDVSGVLDAVRDRRPAPPVDRDRLRRSLTDHVPGAVRDALTHVPAPDAPTDPPVAAFAAVVAVTAPDPAHGVVLVVTEYVRQAADREGAAAEVTARLAAAAAGAVPAEEHLPPTREDRDRLAAERRARDDARAAAATRARDALVWGPVAPSPRLRALPGNAPWLSVEHHDLAERLAHAPVAVQRAVALLTARQAVVAAGLTGDVEVVGVLDALDAGLPAPYVDREAWWARVFPGPGRVEIRVGRPADAPPVRLDPRATALDGVLLLASQDDPATAVVGVVASVLHGATDREREAAGLVALLDALGA